jgi:glycosyltransferase involved in cell wall biosynthesis
MKVLIVHNTYQQKGGEDQVVSLEADLLKKHGIEVEVFITSNDLINSGYAKIVTAINLVYSNQARKVIREKIKTFQPDIVHVHNFFPLLTPSIFYECKAQNVAVVHTLHNYRLICPTATLLHHGKIYKKSIEKSAFHAVFNKVYRNSYLGTFFLALMIEIHKRIGTWQNKVDQFIALTDFAKKKFTDVGFPISKISVKPNFIEDPFKGQSPLQTREQFALFVGRISEEKGVEVLLKAWEKIDYPIKIIGDGPLLKQLTVKYTSEKITFLGAQPQSFVKEVMTKAKFMVMPSIWYEGFPMVIVEALAHGLPIVCSKLGAMEEIIENGTTGIHFRPSDSNDLVIKINYLINHNHLIEEMSENSRQVYLNQYNPDKNFKQLLNIYEKALEPIQ